ncbi:hypothetical protein J437_LFUL016695 [Ladona fulva]|uniref:Uncharacterized protein n=1 Tax=Ladona fulva TaxID=123851 RepID=A0A8K0PCX5_LADFU|nr:hypothetical protein J437_LFUL016695 [Ladona fulva]
MPEDRKVKKIYIGHPGGRRLRGRPRKRCLDDLRKMKIKRWRMHASDVWADIVREALQGM